MSLLLMAAGWLASFLTCTRMQLHAATFLLPCLLESYSSPLATSGLGKRTRLDVP
ncbi:hypothetical protein GUITHDRAFT_155531 [Guillardia theta CCMP2712]|uniref:Uncharacterized protein n=1 Tax=Guillardia theta (strain CCMP2712) TaxID=905079 RepID=L1IHK5_GUITC|nr:hypothetical protein GUITHDRAFT_155531 [Guillardia theta CCMP2712]EKX35275.1 hypothetical protein GUITHDRAFT_155531 [Guillardia theta CCMP2712]|eukprot:XP_005822255.1 hypothetical protein GUITHDRAFT_155531 [Guillardia theta CCMP2712]